MVQQVLYGDINFISHHTLYFTSRYLVNSTLNYTAGVTTSMLSVGENVVVDLVAGRWSPTIANKGAARECLAALGTPTSEPLSEPEPSTSPKSKGLQAGFPYPDPRQW